MSVVEKESGKKIDRDRLGRGSGRGREALRHRESKKDERKRKRCQKEIERERETEDERARERMRGCSRGKRETNVRCAPITLAGVWTSTCLVRVGPLLSSSSSR